MMEKNHYEAQQAHEEIVRAAGTIQGRYRQLQGEVEKLRAEAQKYEDAARSAMQMGEESTAQELVTHLVQVEHQLEETQQLALQTQEEARRAEQQVRDLEQRLQVQKYSVSLDDMEAAEASRSGIPTMDEVRDRIEQRYSTALGAETVRQISSPEQDYLQEQQEKARKKAAQSILEQIRSELHP